MTCGWHLDGDAIRNPQGKVVAKLKPNLSHVERDEFRRYLEDAVQEAVNEARYDWEHEHLDPDDFNDFQ